MVPSTCSVLKGCVAGFSVFSRPAIPYHFLRQVMAPSWLAGQDVEAWGGGGSPCPHSLVLRPCVDHQSLAAWVQAVLTFPVVLQGSYDQSRTKVLHMSMNPASAAKQRLREDQAQLQEECKQLRELVHALERGGPIPADLEAVASLPSSKELTGRSLTPASVLWAGGRGRAWARVLRGLQVTAGRDSGSSGEASS